MIRIFISISLICLSSLGVLGQVHCDLIDTSCVGGRFPLNGDKQEAISGVDTIALVDFNSRASRLLDRMNKSYKLNTEESLFLIKTMNTLWFCDAEYMDSLYSKCPSIKLIEQKFQDIYRKALRCQYHCYWGQGAGIYYKELQVNYTGSSPACAMIYIKFPFREGMYFLYDERFKIEILKEGENY